MNELDRIVEESTCMRKIKCWSIDQACEVLRDTVAIEKRAGRYDPNRPLIIYQCVLSKEKGRHWHVGHRRDDHIERGYRMDEARMNGLI